MKPLQPTGHRESGYERPPLAWRVRLARWSGLAAAGAAAFALVALFGPWRLAAVSPGPLAAPHEAIEGPEHGAPNCVACHAAAESGPGRWLWSALAGSEPLADDDRCLDCHFEGASRSAAAQVHSTTPDRLAALTDAVEEPGGTWSLANLLGAPARDPGGRLACATCHRDHQGRDRSLTQLADASCQVCHARRFDSLAEGHPEFHPVPRPRAGIAFDHSRHREGDHFGDTPFECERCHVPERAGRAMDLVPFDTACRGCHHQGREDHHGDSIGVVEVTLLQLPEMELPEDVVWPRDAAWGDDVMPPLMRLLLLGDDEALEPLEQIAEEADGIPYDWLPDDDAPLEEFAAVVRRLVADLAAADPSALQLRLSSALALENSDPRVERLADQLSGARFAAAAWRARWLPGLAADGSGASAPGGPPPDWAGAQPASGWRVDSETGEIVYASSGHADPVFRALIEALRSEDSAADAHDDIRAEERRQLVAELFAERGGPLRGACLRCHVVAEPQPTADPWHALGRGGGSTGFRHFDHRPHTSMLRDPEDCSRCHEIVSRTGEEPAASRGFAPHRRELCASCHTAEGAGEACLLCHDYHFGRP